MTPPFQSFWRETKGGGHSVGINWTFSNPTFSLSLSKDLVRKSSAKDPQKIFAASRRFLLQKHCKKFSPLRGDFYPKNTVKNFAASRRFCPKNTRKKFRRFAAIFNPRNTSNAFLHTGFSVCKRRRRNFLRLKALV